MFANAYAVSFMDALGNAILAKQPKVHTREGQTSKQATRETNMTYKKNKRTTNRHKYQENIKCIDMCMSKKWATEKNEQILNVKHNNTC